MRRLLVSRGMIIILVGTMVLSANLVVMAARVGAAPPNKGESSGTTTQNWDTVLPADQRFTVLSAFNNEAVRDNETGLVWQRSPSDQSTAWIWSKVHCFRNTITGQKRGWRVPSIEELTSLLAVSSQDPTLPIGHPFMGVQPGAFYWSSTRRTDGEPEVWAVQFSNSPSTGYQVHFANILSAGLTWCVRGGSGSHE